jgi:hypothetical protein
MATPPLFSPWQELGIAPTTDQQAIRRAYAQRLKALDVEAQPDAFARLRAAFEAVLRRPGATPPPAPPRADGGTVVMPEPDAALAAIRALLEGGRLTEAFALLEEAGGRLAFAETEALQAEFLVRAGEPAPLPDGLLLRMARRFDWGNALHPLRRSRAAAFATLDRRLDAELWYAELRACAARPKPLLRRDDRRLAARALLRGAPSWYERLYPRTLQLGRPRLASVLVAELQAFDRHAAWVGERFDERRIRWCRRRRRNARAKSLGTIFGVWGAIIIIAALKDHPHLAQMLIGFTAIAIGASVVAYGVWKLVSTAVAVLRWLWVKVFLRGNKRA